MLTTEISEWVRLVEAYAGRRGVTREHAERALAEMRDHYPATFASLLAALVPAA